MKAMMYNYRSVNFLLENHAYWSLLKYTRPDVYLMGINSHIHKDVDDRDRFFLFKFVIHKEFDEWFGWIREYQ